MSTLADRSIAALRTVHDELAGVVPRLTDEQLTGPSGASEWTVAQVLSHLGSGGEIALAGYRAALDGDPAPGQSFNESVWDRWNALTPQEQTAAFLKHDAVVVHTLEGLSAEQRESTTVKLGFLSGFVGKADQLADPAVITIADSGAAIVIDDSVSLSRSPGEPTARFEGDLEVAMRLLSGRLKAPYVPQGLRVTGNVTLADLQRVFPGY